MKRPDLVPPIAARVGVRLAGTGCHYPEGKVTNADLEKLIDTNDEWIVQRTGIRERRRCDPSKGENTTWICSQALGKALEDARIPASELDLIILASVTGDNPCPATACRVGAAVGAGHAGAFDLLAACSGFVYGLNIAHDMIRMGGYRTVAVIGCDVMSKMMDYSDRGVCILFGDAAGAAVLRATDDPSRGMLAGSMYADGSRWHDLYVPTSDFDLPPNQLPEEVKHGKLRMNGREVYKFAVGTFAGLIECYAMAIPFYRMTMIGDVVLHGRLAGAA